MSEGRGETQHHKGGWDAGAEDEFGLVWYCDLDCPHPEHDDDPDDEFGRKEPKS